MKRGLENDYIIDYNASEITFTNEFFITENTRIHVEFEYNNRNYPSSIITSNHIVESNKIKFNVMLFSENDWKRQNYITDLSHEEEQILSMQGDNTENIFSNSIDSVNFSEDKILYEKLDTNIQNIDIVFYKFSNDSTSEGLVIIRISLISNNINVDKG